MWTQKKFFAMEYLLLAIAILNLTSFVVRSVFTTHPPGHQCDYRNHCVYNYNIQNCQQYARAGFPTCVHPVVLTSRPVISKRQNNRQVFVDDRTNKNECINRHQSNRQFDRVLKYSKEQLLCLRKPQSVPNHLITHLSILGIKNEKCLCNKRKRFKRGSRGGRKKTKRPVTSMSPSVISDAQTDTEIDQSRHLKVLLLNTQSARNKTDVLNDLILSSNSDIIFLTESWVRPIGDEVIVSKLTPTGFNAVPFPRQTRDGGGICLVYRSSMNIVTRAINEFPTFECCECRLNHQGQNFTFICIYHPPRNKKNRHTAKEFSMELQECLNKYITNKSMPIVLGDFNLHWDNQAHPDMKHVIDIVKTYGLHQLVNYPTQKKGHILDWVLTDNISMIRDISVKDKCISDHSVIVFEIDIKKPENNKRVITSRSNAIDHGQFSLDIKTLLPSISECSSDKVEAYNTCLENLIDQHAPLRTRTVTDRPSAPWMTLEIKQAKAERRRAERKWRATNGTVFKEIYRHCLNKVKALIISAKNAYYNSKITECLTSKALFHVTGSMSGKKTPLSLPTSISKRDLPGVFASFFKEKVTKIRDSLDKSTHKAPHFEPFRGDHFSKFQPVTQAEVKEVIKSSPPKSCSLDPIPTTLLVTHLDSLIEVITIIINESLRDGIVPKSFKQAVVVPLLKKPSLSPDELKNFRPVSNLPFLSKILEKIVLKQLKDHLIKNDLIENFQSAYRECHNTETALLRVRNDLLCEADEGKISILALLDLSAAFDTIDHAILIKRLSRTFGISGVVLDWFESYLLGRSQSVSVQAVRSSTFELDFGVPQGSVLGPILYTLYTQPLGALIKMHNVNYHLYADDTQLYKSCLPHDDITLLSTMERCIDDVKSWMIDKKLKMNEDKTEVLLCNPKKMCTSIPNHIIIEDKKIVFTEKAKNLGIIFDNMLSMEPHFNYLSQMLYCELRRIGQMSTFLNQTSLKTLMSAFLLTRLDYCNSLFVNLPDDNLNKLQRFQNQAAKMILRKKKRDHVTPLLRILHWLPLRARLTYKTAVLCFKCIHKKAPLYLQELVQLYCPSRSLRSSSQCLLRIPKKGSVKLAERSFTHAGPAVWNSLPLKLRTITSETEFKSCLKTYLYKLYLDD